jgi:hypothetical protein
MTTDQEYAVKIAAQLQEIFNEGSENYIDLQKLMTDNTATDFMHALANIVPAMVYNKLTGEELNSLDFNHIANKLCFQYSKKVD